MIKKIVLTLFCLLISLSVWSFDYDVKEDYLSLNINFKNVPKLIEKKVNKNTVYYLIDGLKGEQFNREFLGLPVSYVKGYYDANGQYNIEISYINNVVEPTFKVNGNNLNIVIPFQNGVSYSNAHAVSPYIRIVVGLIIVLLMIIFSFIIFKFLYKKKLHQVIPGVGRVLGKMDLIPGVSLIFVELGSILYILAYTNASVTMIDKLTDDEEISKLKKGFSKYQDFSSYLRFFGKKITKEDMEITKTIVREKIESLRKK
ncbi:hypothetical protein FHQ18_04455 [Deferribacter autotrophicus]|uniref:DUF3592 domain-containing protein n=1 Tax=Deferribacter autotrophicus TaxID=500465 RepID=A0A5A8F4H9_9BACT|nr:hypothetical protein [Deferribacter autotrophicus]KAA0258416.1 hypothetical protein FHQ18_04455 [Deferribacter autotrophicus]